MYKLTIKVIIFVTITQNICNCIIVTVTNEKKYNAVTNLLLKKNKKVTVTINDVISGK